MEIAGELALRVDGRADLRAFEITSVQGFLDDIAARFHSDEIFDALYDLKDGLTTIRNGVDKGAWAEIRKAIIKHPLRRLIHQDPFTRRSFEKPRGYPGDAVILDFIYGSDNVAEELRAATPLGMQIYEACYTVPTCSAVRYRRDMIARVVDELAAERKGLTVMSVACGHLREAGLSAALRDGRVGNWLAIDQDEASINYVRGLYKDLPVEPVVGMAASIIAGHLGYEDLDFIYSAGLYDYLPDQAAVALTRSLYSMLKPGGRLLIANFLPQLPDAGYMETYMGWKLIFRQRGDMERMVTDAIGDSAKVDIFIDPPDALIFVQITK